MDGVEESWFEKWDAASALLSAKDPLTRGCQ